MLFVNGLSCFSLIILFLLNKCEPKVNLVIINVPYKDWKSDLRQSILRDKYSDACLKVAIRKCFKALMEVSKNVCRRHFRCSSDFRSSFKNSSKTGCIKEFDYSRMFSSKQNKKDGYRFTKATRTTFLDACIPHMVPQYKEENINSLRRDALKTLIEGILRSDSERKCQKLSRYKCIKACNYARKEICRRHDCSRRRKKQFKTSCKEKCREEYFVREAKSSKSSSDSD